MSHGQGDKQMKKTFRVNRRLTIDEYMASVGVDMLHAGGMRRTKDLAEMCQISEGETVLDVGCGFGRTSCYLAREYRCIVIGIDLSETMIRGAMKKTRKVCVDDIVHLYLGSAENLPFKDGSFDVVISEGTTVFADKNRAMDEYVRVTKSGGHVGLNELSWRKRPSDEIEIRTFQDLQGVRSLGYKGWEMFLTDSGLIDVESRTYKYKSTSWDIIRSIGIRSLIRVGIRYLTNYEMRSWISRQENLFRDYSEYWGYGLYAGRKP